MVENGCGDPKCKVSTGIHDDQKHPLSGLTFGKGDLDFNGYWSKPCFKCARAFEKLHPEAVPCWPFKENPNGIES